MTEANASNSGTIGTASPPSSSGSGARLTSDDLNAAVSRLLKKEQPNGEGDNPEGSAEEGDDQERGRRPDEPAAGDAGTDGDGAAEESDAAPGAGEREAPEGEAGDAGDPIDGELSFRDAARRLKIPAKELYKSLVVPLNDGTGRSVSVEELKAGYLGSDDDSLAAGRHALQQEQAVFEKDRQEKSNEIVRQRRELDIAVELLGEMTPAPVLEALRTEVRNTVAREAQQLLEHMPQFKDRTVFQGWMSEAGSVLGNYGFNQAEVANMADHRIFRFVNDFLALQKRIDGIENAPADPPKLPKSPKRRKGRAPDKTRALVDKAKATKSRQDQVAAVGALISRG